eukprot:1400670-Pyramimonas_sp.AAC.1
MSRWLTVGCRTILMISCACSFGIGRPRSRRGTRRGITMAARVGRESRANAGGPLGRHCLARTAASRDGTVAGGGRG